MVEPKDPPSLLLVLHDIAPPTWADYQPFVEAVDALGNVPMTWLVVPNFHKHNDLEAHPGFRRLLSGRLALGDELALHGYFHCDDGPMASNPRDWFTRLHAGIDMFQRYHWPLHGFVAPAWLMSEGTRQALRQLPLSYTSDPQHLYKLPDFAVVDAPGLVWSARSAWRRGLSKLVSDQREQRWRQAPVIRLGLHPVDMRHEFSRTYWLQTLKRLIAEGRVPMTKARWQARHSERMGRAA
jgi:predicted deacetylase